MGRLNSDDDRPKQKPKQENKMNTLDKYKMNLKVDDAFVYSYDTKVATIDHINKRVKPLGWWSVTTSKHINYVAREYGYEAYNAIKC